MKITAVILTRNEEKNILDCLKSLLWCDEVIVVDDYSVDKTINKIKSLKFKVRIFKRHLNNDFASQRNFGLDKAKNEWVLFVDADEKISKNLSQEILEKIKNKKDSGFYIKRLDFFSGKEIKHGESGNIKLLRLARKNSGKWKRKVHEYWDIKGNIGSLKNPILHSKSQNLVEFVEKINFYSTIHAKELKREGKKSRFYKIIFWPIGKFLVNYFLKLGFFDGTEGFMMAVIMSFHSFLSWSKAWIS